MNCLTTVCKLCWVAVSPRIPVVHVGWLKGRSERPSGLHNPTTEDKTMTLAELVLLTPLLTRFATEGSLSEVVRFINALMRVV